MKVYGGGWGVHPQEVFWKNGAKFLSILKGGPLMKIYTWFAWRWGLILHGCMARDKNETHYYSAERSLNQLSIIFVTIFLMEILI